MPHGELSEVKLTLGRELGEVYISREPAFAGFPQQCQQVSTFGLASPASNEDDQTGIWMCGDQGKKIVSIAGDKKLTVPGGVVQNRQITGVHGQDLSQYRDLVP